MGHYTGAPPPREEEARLAALHEAGLLDTGSEAAFDDAVRLASRICEVPVSLISLVDRNRQWFKANIGFAEKETPRDQAFCAHTILQSDVFVVPDTLADPGFRENPLVKESPNIRFYAGAPLVTSDGHALGALCVIDHAPRELTDSQRASLKALARQVAALVELRRGVQAQKRASDTIARQLESASATGARLAELELFQRLISHDLHEPLRGMVGFLQLLMRRSGAGLDDRSRDYLAGALGSARQLQALLHGLETYSQLGMRAPDVSEVDCATVVESALDRVCSRVMELGGNITCDSLPRVRADALRVALLFDNLLDNAVKFRSQDAAPRIRLTSERAGADWRISVEDNGIGIEPVYLERIFEGAKRLHARDDITGAGMGLAVCRRIVDKHGGRIWAESDGAGRGSTFRFTLPAADG